MTTGDDSGSRSDQIDVDTLFEAQEKERRRRRGWIAAALVGVVAAGAVTGGVVTGAFTGDDADTDAADGPDTLGTSESASGEEPIAGASESAPSPASPTASATSPEGGEDATPPATPSESAEGGSSPASPGDDAEDGSPTAATDDAGEDGVGGDGLGEDGAGEDGAAQDDTERPATESPATESPAAPGSPGAENPEAGAPAASPGDGASSSSSSSPDEGAREVTTYAVSSGDSLWSITEQALPGDPSDQAVVDTWPTVYEANRDVIGDDPNVIRSGEQLSIPDLAAGRGSAAPTTGASRQVVAPGDSLWSITDDALGGDASPEQVLAAWPTVYEANRQVIGDDPDLIRVGQELVVPALG